MSEEEFERAMDRYELDQEYSEYIASQTSIGNGTMLINAIESGDYYEGFKERMVDQLVCTQCTECAPTSESGLGAVGAVHPTPPKGVGANAHPRESET